MTLKEMQAQVAKALSDYNTREITILALDTIVHESVDAAYKAGYRDGLADADDEDDDDIEFDSDIDFEGFTDEDIR